MPSFKTWATIALPSATSGATHRLLCEGVEASLALPVDSSKVRFYALDESGNRKATIPVSNRSGKTVLEIGPEHKTIWYEIEIAP